MPRADAGRPLSAWGKLAVLELVFTVLPAVLFPAAIVALTMIFPPAGLAVLVLAFLYCLPAFVILNSLGYRTVQGPVPVPIPAGSVSALLALVAVHALLVAAVFLLVKAAVGFDRWVVRQLGR